MMHVFDEWANTFVGSGEDSNNGLSAAQANAEAYFENLTSSNNGNAAKIASNNLASLISKMEQPLSSKLYLPKARALHCLLGATEGIKKETSIPRNMVEILSRFYLQYCGPHEDIEITLSPEHGSNIDNNMQENYSIENLRDTALLCLTMLIQCPFVDPDNVDIRGDFVKLRISLMKEAIQKRCTSMDYDDEDDDILDDYSDDDNGSVMQSDSRIFSGLSLLPRAKRTLCFDALNAAISGIAIDIDHILTCDSFSKQADLLEKLHYLTKFASSCLHGESDPRCLMQMLTLLTKLQATILPFCFKETNASSGLTEKSLEFPFLSIFDAVAPYYPIKFTPPPNDPFGISKEALQTALLNVLTYSTHWNNGIVGTQIQGDNNMTTLAIRLCLERLSTEQHPYDDDQNEENITPQDRLDTLYDLKEIIFCSEQRDSKQSEALIGSDSHVSVLSIDVVKDLRNILCRCHEEASSSVLSSSNNEEKNLNKEVSDFCRSISNRLAYGFEMQILLKDEKDTVKESSWQYFVRDSVHQLVDTITLEPQSLKGRSSIAFIASLAACGGERTLRLCLGLCIPTLFQRLKKWDNVTNDEQQTSFFLGCIGVLFASSRVSIEVMSKENIAIHPHPLQSFSSDAIQMLCAIIGSDKASIQLKAAVVKALDSVLLSTPIDIVSNIELVKETVLQLVHSMIDHISAIHVDQEVSTDWSESCIRFLGTAVGRCLSVNVSSKTALLSIYENDDDISKFVKEIVLPKILETSIMECKRQDIVRMDWKMLAFACRCGGSNVSDFILSHLFKILKRITNITLISHDQSVRTVALAISHIIKQGGAHPVHIFHSKGFQIDLIDILSQPRTQAHNEVEMSTLLLPDTRMKRQAEANQRIQMALQVLPPLLSSYRHLTPADGIEKIVSMVVDLLPALSEWDNARLYIILPILSIILSGDGNVDDKQITPLISSLIEFTLARENDAATRVAAGHCIFSIILNHAGDKEITKAIVENVLSNTLSPSIFVKLQYLTSGTLTFEEQVELEDLLQVTAMIGTAALCYGNILYSVGNEVVTFLSKLACVHDIGDLGSITSKFTKALNLSNISHDDKITISKMGSNSFTSILNVNRGNIIWKQRISYCVESTLISQATVSSLDHGRLLCIGSLVCCNPARFWGEKKISSIILILAKGLESCSMSEEFRMEKKMNKEVKLLLATSFLKLLDDSPILIERHMRRILPLTVLTLVATTNIQEIATQLVALQILKNLSTRQFQDQGALNFCLKYRDTVIANVGTILDHNSLQIRQAAAVVRNCWFIMT